jgi:Nuclease-related domain
MASTPHTGLQQLRSALNPQFLATIWPKVLELLRNPGFQPYYLVAFTLWLVGTVEIIQKIGGQHLDPRFWMLVAILITVYSGVRIFRLTPLATTGNRKWPTALTDMITRMQANGFDVYPAPNQDKENAGFVLVGRSGVFAMEVKSRKVFGSRRIEFGSGNELILGGRISDRRPVQQAQGTAEIIREKLAEIGAESSIVTPLVVFLDGWTVSFGSAHDVPVVTAGELEPFLNAQPAVLSDSEVVEVSACLAATC